MIILCVDILIKKNNVDSCWLVQKFLRLIAFSLDCHIDINPYHNPPTSLANTHLVVMVT